MKGLLAMSPVTVLRLSRGWSTRELAARVGCTSDHLARVARGVQRPSPVLAVKLADVLGVPPEVLGLRPRRNRAQQEDYH